MWSEFLFIDIFFFKQKTAYELRISDWRSDGCSSDLPHRTRDGYLCLLPYTAQHWHAMFDILGRPDLHDDPRFAQATGRINEVEEIGRASCRARACQYV